MRQRLLLFILLTGLSIILLGSPSPSEANIITVDGICTLADAIIAANTDTATGNCPAGSVGPDTIVLDVDVSLTSVYPSSTTIGGGQAGLPDITSDITIQSGLQDLIEGNNTTFRLVYVAPGASLTIDGADFGNGKIINAAGAALGGAIYSDGTLDISNSTFFLNDVDGDDAGGGAIYIGASGSLSVTNSDFSLNSSTGTTSSFGGSICAEGPITNIINTDVDGISSGSGGAIAADTISQIQGGQFWGRAEDYGGSIYANFIGTFDGATVGFCCDETHAFYGGGLALVNGFTTISNSTFETNEAMRGGALWIGSTNGSQASITNTQFTPLNCAGEGGGSIWLSTDAIVSISNSEFSDSHSPFCADGEPISYNPGGSSGGGIYNQGVLTVSSSTFSNIQILHNQSKGAAIYNDNGSVYVEDSTFDSTQVFAGEASAFAAGGAIYSEGNLTVLRSHFLATDATTEDDHASAGGAIYSVGQAEIADNTFHFSLVLSELPTPNKAGGAIYVEGQADITNNFFKVSAIAAGTSDFEIPIGSGGAVFIDASQPSTVQHNTFVDSIALNGEVMYANGLVTVSGNIFASDGYPNYDNNPDCTLLSGVTGANNLHLTGDTSCDSISSGTIDLGVHIDESTGLLQSVYGNPAIDGNPGCGLATDGLGNPRIGACDIGYHELQLSSPTPTSTFTPTFTPSLTPTFSPTVTASLTPTDTPTATETPSGPSALVVTAMCVDENLAVTISTGDGPFNITASAGINTPVNGVSIGTTTINGPEKWDNLTVMETSGDGQSVDLGQFKCRTDERPVPLTPAHRERTTNPFPLFSWTAISGANNYRVFVFDDKVVANRTVDIRQNSGGATSLTLSTPLPDGRLFWRVRGRTNRVWGLWSVRFTLFKDPVAPVTANTPVPTIELEQPSGDELTPTPVPTVGPVPTFPAPPNSR